MQAGNAVSLFGDGLTDDSDTAHDLAIPLMADRPEAVPETGSMVWDGRGMRGLSRQQ
jgi:hypothetical protein